MRVNISDYQWFKSIFIVLIYTTTAWRGDYSTDTQGIGDLDTSLGHDDFLRTFLQLWIMQLCCNVQWCLITVVVATSSRQCKGQLFDSCVSPELCGAFEEPRLWRYLCATVGLSSTNATQRHKDPPLCIWSLEAWVFAAQQGVELLLIHSSWARPSASPWV